MEKETENVDGVVEENARF